MLTSKFAEALQYKYPHAAYTIKSNSEGNFLYEGLEWLDENLAKPSEEELEEAIEELVYQEMNKQPDPNYKGFMDALRSTSIFGKAMQTSNTNAFTLLMATLTSPFPVKADFLFALELVKEGVPALSAEEEAQLNEILINNYLT